MVSAHLRAKWLWVRILSLNLIIPEFNQVSYGKKSLRTFGPKLWNSLPHHINLLKIQNPSKGQFDPRSDSDGKVQLNLDMAIMYSIWHFTCSKSAKKHQNNNPNIFSFNDKDTRRASGASIVNFKHISHFYYTVNIAEFEQINAG